jgi:hypothetical protein
MYKYVLSISNKQIHRYKNINMHTIIKYVKHIYTLVYNYKHTLKNIFSKYNKHIQNEAIPILDFLK